MFPSNAPRPHRRAHRRPARLDASGAAVHDSLVDAFAIPPDLMVVLTENGLADWSFGNGEAQYL